MQLRMVPVPLCLATQHRSGEKTLPPKRHETLGIEILRMECPEAHIRCQWCPALKRSSHVPTPRGERTIFTALAEFRQSILHPPLQRELSAPAESIEKFPCFSTIEPTYPSAGNHREIEIHRVHADGVPIVLLPVLIVRYTTAFFASIVVANSILPRVTLQRGSWSLNLH